MADILSKLLDERRDHVRLIADWQRRWRKAWRDSGRSDDAVMAGVKPIDDAAAEMIAETAQASPALLGGGTQPA